MSPALKRENEALVGWVLLACMLAVLQGALLMADGASAWVSYGSLAVSVISLGISGWVAIGSKAWRTFRMFNPCRSEILIPAGDVFRVPNIQQDDDEHHLNSVVLPSRADCILLLRVEPKIAFSPDQVSVGFEGDMRKRPFIVSYLDANRRPNEGRDRPADDDNFINAHGNFEMHRNPKYNVGWPVVLGFNIKTQEAGTFVLELNIATEFKVYRKKFGATVQDDPVLPMIDTKKRSVRAQRPA